MTLFGWQTSCVFLIVFAMILMVSETGSAAEWRSWTESGFSSSYHTRSWFDSTDAQLIGPLGARWRLAQNLDLLRNDLSSGGDVRQRDHRISLTGLPQRARTGWTLDLRGEESTIEETVDRRTLLGEALVGRLFTWRDQLTAQVKAGAIVSQHSAADQSTTEAGLGHQATVSWNPDIRASSIPLPTSVNASARYEGDQRRDLRAREAEWSWGSRWLWDRDSLDLDWGEEWSTTQFYPNPQQFDLIGRQDHRRRSLRFGWNHAASNAPARGLAILTAPLRWQVDASTSLNNDVYESVGPGGAPAALPRDTRSTQREYRLQTGRSLGPVVTEVSYRYRWVKDRFGEQRRDQTAEVGEVAGLLRWQATPGDSVIVRATFGVTSYAAPGDSSFFEDRDQAERVIELTWWRRVSSVFAIRPTFVFRGYRQVFISERLSANNNTDDVYLFAPEFDWRPTRSVSLRQRISIRAHYRFFDFDRTDPEGRGTLYRRAESESLTRIRQSARLSWRLRYVYRYEDFGGLFDRDGWVQSVDWDRRSHLLNATLEWRPAHGWLIAPNLGLEFKRSFQHRLDGDEISRIKIEPFRRRYVGLELSWMSRAGYQLRFSLARRVQQFGGAGPDRDDRWTLYFARNVL